MRDSHWAQDIALNGCLDEQMEKTQVSLRRKTSALNKSKIQDSGTFFRSEGCDTRTGRVKLEMLSIVDTNPGLEPR